MAKLKRGKPKAVVPVRKYPMPVKAGKPKGLLG